MVNYNRPLEIKRLPQLQKDYPEIKDPSLVKTADGWLMYATIGHSSGQAWKVGRFHAEKPEDIWRETEPVEFVGLSGPQLCAPAVIRQPDNSENPFTMYIQTACFEENGVIIQAHSSDGRTFRGIQASLVAKDNLTGNGRYPVVGVYDAGLSEIRLNGEDFLALVFSGYRRVGSGDIYLSLKKKNQSDNWSKPRLIIEQEDVPFHNRPQYENYEWGLEGGKIEQLAPDLFLFVGVCFLPLPKGFEGKRQRIFFSAARNISGPYVPLGTPFPPQTGGEHGHPDTVIRRNEILIVFQERQGDRQPWQLRIAGLDRQKLTDHARQSLSWSPLVQINDQLPKDYAQIH